MLGAGLVTGRYWAGIFSDKSVGAQLGGAGRFFRLFCVGAVGLVTGASVGGTFSEK